MKYQRYVLIAFVCLAAVVGTSVQAAALSGFTQFGVDDSALAGVVPPSTLLALVSGAVTFGVLLRNSRAVQFTDEAVGELLRVTWPSRDETVRAATTVVMTTAFAATLIAAYDLLWKSAAQYFLFNQG